MLVLSGSSQRQDALAAGFQCTLQIAEEPNRDKIAYRCDSKELDSQLEHFDST